MCTNTEKELKLLKDSLEGLEKLISHLEKVIVVLHKEKKEMLKNDKP